MKHRTASPNESDKVDNTSLFAAIAAIARGIPEKSLARLPTDGAANVDAYLRRRAVRRDRLFAVDELLNPDERAALRASIEKGLSEGDPASRFPRTKR